MDRDDDRGEESLLEERKEDVVGEEDFEDQGFFDSEVVKNGVESKEMCLDDEAVSENERG